MELYHCILMMFIILLTGVLLLCQWSTTFNYFCKVAFFIFWILLMTIIITPFVAVFQGRCVENMKYLRAFILPVKYFFNIKITVQGSENLNITGPYVIVANHQSWFDLLGMVEVLPDRCVPVAKKELLYLGTVGWACWICKMIFIDRKKRHEAMDILEKVAQSMRQDNVRVWVYPEGTRNEEKTMLPFKRGAFNLAVKAQVPVIPTVISSYRNTYSSKEKKFVPGNWTIRILPKIETQGLGPEDITALAETTRQTMLDTLHEISE